MFKKVLIMTILSFLTFSTAFADGAALYKKARCLECHGENGEGNKEKEAPRIAGQHEWYILSSLRAFKSKERKNVEMYPYIQNLSDKDFQDLATYLGSL